MPKLPHEYLPPEAWDAFFKPRGPLGLISGRTALDFVPGVSQGLSAMDTAQAVREEDPVGAGLSGLGVLPGGGFLKKAGGPAADLIAGRHAKTFDKKKGEEALRKAWDLFRSGGPRKLTKEEKTRIFNETGGYWPEPSPSLGPMIGSEGIRGVSKLGREAAFEISDAGFKLQPKALQKVMKGEYSDLGDGTHMFLDDFVEHPALFEAYPELKNLSVRFEKMDGVRGLFKSGKNLRIVVDPRVIQDNPDLMLHELQHAIAYIEDFQPGFGRYEYYKKAALEKGMTEAMAEKTWRAMHNLDYGEDLARAPAKRWENMQTLGQSGDLDKYVDPETGLYSGKLRKDAWYKDNPPTEYLEETGRNFTTGEEDATFAEFLRDLLED